MKPEDYIGKKLSECPDGTKAVVVYKSGMELVREIRGGTVSSCGDDNPVNRGDGSHYTVTHILTLGKPRPKTLSDEEPGVVWADEDGDLFWNDGDGCACCMLLRERSHPESCESGPYAFDINPDWTRLGPITGIEIDGKVYRGEGGGE